MKIIPTEIPDVLIIEPKVFEDERGFFFESFNQTNYEKYIGTHEPFVQDNHSKSVKGVLRGLHIQREPFSQGKLVRCISGQIFDVAVDLRPDSLTFGKWTSLILSEQNKKQLWIPKGFAHGFYVLSEHAEFVYKCVGYYNPDAEVSIKWDDPDIDISWPIPETQKPSLSKKDNQAYSLKDYKQFLEEKK
ncbi:TPA: dTDP-4-dehydrorhamnose 3,5-epimerase [Providencia rettgeri]